MRLLDDQEKEKHSVLDNLIFQTFFKESSSFFMLLVMETALFWT